MSKVSQLLGRIARKYVRRCGLLLRLSSVVCRSVGRSVCHTFKPLVEDSVGSREPCISISWGVDPVDPRGNGQFWGKGRPL